MNERIKELIDQATSIEKGPPNWDVTANTVIKTFDNEKFADLIVQECAGICKVIGDAHLNDLEGSPEFGHGAYFAAKQIKDHFGVK